jgi:hypothetical protein
MAFVSVPGKMSWSGSVRHYNGRCLALRSGRRLVFCLPVHQLMSWFFLFAFWHRLWDEGWLGIGGVTAYETTTFHEPRRSMESRTVRQEKRAFRGGMTGFPWRDVPR